MSEIPLSNNTFVSRVNRLRGPLRRLRDPLADRRSKTNRERFISLFNIAAYDSSEFVLETADNETGFKNVIKVKERYQARLYDKVKQTQRHLPGLFDTAEEAAKYRALVMRDELVPPTTKPRAPRGSKGDANATCRPPRLLSHACLRVLCAAKAPPGVHKKPPRVRPAAASRAALGEDYSPQKAPSPAVPGPEAATGRPMVATVARVYALGEPVSPRAMCARLADVVFAGRP